MHRKDKKSTRSKSISTSILGLVKPKKSKANKEAEAAKKAAEEAKQKELAAFTKTQNDLTKQAEQTREFTRRTNEAAREAEKTKKAMKESVNQTTLEGVRQTIFDNAIAEAQKEFDQLEQLEEKASKEEKSKEEKEIPEFFDVNVFNVEVEKVEQKELKEDVDVEFVMPFDVEVKPLDAKEEKEQRAKGKEREQIEIGTTIIDPKTRKIRLGVEKGTKEQASEQQTPRSPTSARSANTTYHSTRTVASQRKNLDPNVEADTGKTPLHLAAEKNLMALELLLTENRNAINDINKQDFNGNTPLHIGAGALNNEGWLIVSRLLELGADHTITNKQGDTALKLAIKVEGPKQKKIIDELLKQDTAGGIVIKHIKVALASEKKSQPHIHINNEIISEIDIPDSDEETIEAIINKYINKNSKNSDKQNEITFLKSFIKNFSEPDLLKKRPDEMIEKKGNEKRSTNDSTIASPKSAGDIGDIIKRVIEKEQGKSEISAGEHIINIIDCIIEKEQASISKSKSEIAQKIVQVIRGADKNALESSLDTFWQNKTKPLTGAIIDAINNPEQSDDSIADIIINWKQAHLTPKNESEEAYYASVQSSVNQFFTALKAFPGIQDQLKKKPNENKDSTPESTQRFSESIQSFIKTCKDNNQDPLCEAVKKGNLKFVGKLLDPDHGYDPTAYVNGQTALHLAVITAGEKIEKIKSQFGFGEKTIEAETVIFKKLLEKVKENNLDVNVKNKDGDTPLHLAVKFKELGNTIVKPLLNAGADKTLTNNKGETSVDSSKTSLHLAVINKDMETLSKLIDEKVDVNEKDLGGKTALHYAVENTDYDNRALMGLIVNSLLGVGADFNLKHEGKTALDKAEENKIRNEFVITILKEKKDQYELAKKWENSAGKFVTDRIKANINNKTVTKDVETKVKNLCDSIQKQDANDNTPMEVIITTWINENKNKSGAGLFHRPSKKSSSEEDFIKVLMESPEIKEQLQKSPYEPKEGIALRTKELQRIGKPGGGLF